MWGSNFLAHAMRNRRAAHGRVLLLFPSTILSLLLGFKNSKRKKNTLFYGQTQCQQGRVERGLKKLALNYRPYKNSNERDTFK